MQENLSENRLLLRNQFVMGPEYVDFPGWARLEINPALRISAHPDLNLCQIRNKSLQITLLGYILDPFKPELGNEEVLKEIISNAAKIKDFIPLTYPMGGRWILVVSDGMDIRIFNDATGLRQIYYSVTGIGNRNVGIWCASQPDLIAEILNLKKDRSAVEFAEAYSRVDDEYYLPGNVSFYKEIKHLLPNWYLELNKGRAVRFWPEAPKKEIPADEAAFKAASILKGLMNGIIHRGEVVLSLTSGLDSRVVLSASKDIIKKIVAMSIQKDSDERHADLVVPAALGAKLGFKHEIVKRADGVDNDFREIYYRNAVFAHEAWMPDAQAISEYYRRGKIVVTGSASEIGRCWFAKHRSLKTDSVRLCIMRGMKSRFALAAFQDWLKGLGNIHGYHHLDLFEWEQGTGNWLAANQIEFDIAWKEIFTPFNCRELLILLLSVNEKYRKAPDYELFRMIIRRLWPEAFSEPINPHKKINALEELKSDIKLRLIDLKYRFVEYA